jgi:hypothetical protein
VAVHVEFLGGKEPWSSRLTDLKRFIELFHQGLIDLLFIGGEVETQWGKALRTADLLLLLAGVLAGYLGSKLGSKSANPGETMYDVDELDEVAEIRDLPRPDTGAPLPVLVADEHRVLLAYIASNPNLARDPSYVTVVTPDTTGMAVALVDFRGPYAHLFGPPNDEAFAGHPLAGRGLRPYSAFQVRHSSWVRRLERMNSVHPLHHAGLFLSMRHYVFAFHDSTFECVAEGYRVRAVRGPIRSMLSRMVEFMSEERD